MVTMRYDVMGIESIFFVTEFLAHDIVSMPRGKVRKFKKKFQVRELSGDFEKCHGI